LDVQDCPGLTVDWRGNNEENSTGGNGLWLEGRGTIRFIGTESGASRIDAVVTNGGTLYIEMSYNEDNYQPTMGFRNLLTASNSTVMYLCGVQHEQSGTNGLDGFWPNGGTTNAFGITNFSGNCTLSLVKGVSDWMRISGAQSGNVWVEGCTTKNSPTLGGLWPITNLTSFLPVQTMNWDYNTTSQLFSNYADIGTATVSYTRTMFAPSRSTYSDLGPMTRRTNQTDVLIEDTILEDSLINLQVKP
jgi:hypothetical protein